MPLAFVAFCFCFHHQVGIKGVPLMAEVAPVVQGQGPIQIVAQQPMVVQQSPQQMVVQQAQFAQQQPRTI
jgi:hypothetical protein